MEISLQEVTFAYQAAGRQWPVLKDINLRVAPGDFLAITGAGGSGKSTLAMLLAGLLEPVSGRVTLNGQPVRGRGKGIGKGLSLWQKVGMVFQQPEQQLFAETVAEDIAFGPRNMGLPADQVGVRVKAALRAVGLDPDGLGGRSPFTLSGGQQRRVAIAGILALEPEVLILDEPTAGLDPAGRAGIIKLIRAFCQQPARAVVLISHNMADVAELARQVVVLHQGRVALQGTPREIFRQGEALRSYGLLPPSWTRLMQGLHRQGAPVPLDVLNLAEARDAILAWLGGGG
ncbi:MAG: energy-coupling factor transport system ATP-binding protein [Clostridia bacterium]|nr:energy-coupling factor transport system ATP-binding protein [Clostridia bacterium]